MLLDREIPRKEFLRVSAGLIGAAFAQPSRASEYASGQPAEKSAADKFAERILSDTAAAMLSFGAYIGDRLGIYRVMAEAGPTTVSELAARTHLNERYLREWLALMATAGYVRYEAATARYSLPREHATVLCDENSPLFMGGFVELMACVFPTNCELELRRVSVLLHERGAHRGRPGIRRRDQRIGNQDARRKSRIQTNPPATG